MFIYTFIRHEDRLEYNKYPNKQTGRQTDRLTNTTTNTTTSQQCTQYKRKKNHKIVLVLKCSYTTYVNSLKFMPITDTPYEQYN